jgi:hypothetical protein
MRKQVLGIGVAILVAASLGVGYLAGNGNVRTRTLSSVSTSFQTITSTTTVEESSTVTTFGVMNSLPKNSSDPYCGTVFENGLDSFGPILSSSPDRVENRLFVMPSNATATICVSFNGMTPSNTLNSSLDQSNFPGALQLLTNNTTPGTPVAGVVITGAPHLITIGGATYPVMVYTVTSSANSTGIYGLRYAYMCPSWLPIAVGFSIPAAQVAIAAGFPFYTLPSSCIDQSNPLGY